MCCTRLAENTGRKKIAKNSPSGDIAQLCRAVSSQLRHVLTIGKKLVKQQYLLHMSSQYGELPPTEIGLPVWDTTANLTVSRLGSVIARHSRSQTLHT